MGKTLKNIDALKVYCSECDYLCEGEFDNYCMSPNNTPMTYNWYGKYRGYKDDPEDKNKCNDCEEFKKRRSLWDKIKGVK